jgi:hypothetical protein
MNRSMHRQVRRLRAVVLGLALLAGSLVVGTPAYACSCAGVDIQLRLADVEGAFVGTYVDRDPIGEEWAVWTFEVERVVKGSFGPTAIVRTNADGASCGIELLDGPRTGLLLNTGEDGVWESSLCGQVSPEQLLAFAPESSPPDPAVAPIGTAWSFASKTVVIAASVVAIAAVLWWLARRRHSLSAGTDDVT